MTCSVPDENSDLRRIPAVLGGAVPSQTRDAVNVDTIS